MPNKKHILYLSAWYPTKYDAMPGLFTRNHALLMSKTYQISVIHFCYSNDAEVGLSINRIGSLTEYVYYAKQINKGIFSVFLKIKQFIDAMHSTYNIIEKEHGKPNLCHVHVLTRMGWFAWRFKRKFDIPYIISEHWSRYLPFPNTYKGFWRKLITNLVVKNAEEVTTVTKKLALAMQNRGLNNNYSTFNNVVDMQLFQIANNKPKTDKINFVHVSCFDNKPKNLTGLLDAIFHLSKNRSDFHCQLIGTGVDFKMIQDYAIDKGLLNTFVTFTGQLEGKILAETMAKTDFLVICSKYENMPVVISEAFACGLPVLSTDVGGISEYVNDQSGKLIESNNPEALLDGLNWMINHCKHFEPEKQRDIAQKHFSEEAVFNQFNQLYLKYAK